MSMRKMFLILACAFAAVLSGCFTGTDREIRYYTLPVTQPAKPSGKPLLPYTLTVTRASVDPAYRRNNIVYRETPYDFMYYTYSAWASRPEFLVEQVAYSYIKSQGLFSVLEYSDIKKPDLEFAIYVKAIEEVDRGSDRFAHLSLMFTLQKPDGETIVWRKNYDESKPFDSSDMRNFAEAIYQILQGFLDDAIAEMKANVK